MLKSGFARRIVCACYSVQSIEDELTRIDAAFGDGDHGYTMAKIMSVIKEAVEESDGSIKEMLDDAAMAVLVLNGGSAVPLWNTWLDGLQEGAADEEEMNVEQLKEMFAAGFEAIDDISGAKVGDKTMMDALIPASQAIAEFEGTEDELFEVAAKAALDGAENSKNFKSKFGRAKAYGDKTIGTPDAGAMSMAYFFKGMAEK